MPATTTEERFHHLQTRWQEASEKWHSYNYEIKRQYGDARGYCWNVPAGKRARQERLESAESKACARFIDFLKVLNPDRSWSTGFPIGYLQDSLSYADATTRERMSITPPPAYGYTPRDAEAFAGPLS